jgi:hypothetical protein
VSFGFTGGTFGSITNAKVELRRPDNSVISWAYCGTSCSLSPVSLSIGGLYTIALLPVGGATGSLTAKLDVGYVRQDVTIGGPTSTITLRSPGQNGVWSFTGAAGQAVSFGFTGGTFGSITNAKVELRRPDSSVISWAYCGTSCSLSPVTLPVTGVYSVVILPGTAIGSLTAKLDAGYVNQNVTIGGPSSTITLRSPGQNGVWSFTGTAGQAVKFEFTGGTFGSVTNAKIEVRKPDKSVLTSWNFCGTSCSSSSMALPVAGIYTITLIPAGIATGSMTATLRAGGG